jgi:hypothetical protein
MKTLEGFMFNGRRSFCVMAVVCVIACLSLSAVAQESGQRNFAQVSVEPAFNDFNGSTVYLLTPDKAPFPSKANPRAVAPLYLPLYPLSSTVPADELNCQPTNCDHVNVIPFPAPGYDILAGTDPICVKWNGGNPCSLVKGHDHLVGVPPTGDFNVAWHVWFVVFTEQGVNNGKSNTRITTLDQINTLVANGDAAIKNTPVTFNCQITSEVTYTKGTPVVIPFP